MNIFHHQQLLSSSERYQQQDQQHLSQQQLQLCSSPKISKSDSHDSDNDDIDDRYNCCQVDSDSCTVCILKHQSNKNSSSIFKHSTIGIKNNVVDNKADMEFAVNCRSSFHTEQTHDLTQSDSTNNNNSDKFYNSFRYDDDDDHNHDNYYEAIESNTTLENIDCFETAVLTLVPVLQQQQQASACTPVAVTATATTIQRLLSKSKTKHKHKQEQSMTTTTTPIIHDSHLQVQFAERTASEMKNIVDWWQYRQQQQHHLLDTTTIVSQQQELLGNSLLLLNQSKESDSHNPIISNNENGNITSSGGGSSIMNATTTVRICASLIQSSTPNSIDAIDSTYQAQFAERTASEMKQIISWWKQCHPKQNSKDKELLDSKNDNKTVNDNVCTSAANSTSTRCSLHDEIALENITESLLEESSTTTSSICPQRHHCPNNSLLMLSSSSSKASNVNNNSCHTILNSTDTPISNFVSIQKELYDSIHMSCSSRRRFRQTTFASKIQHIQSINSKHTGSCLIPEQDESSIVVDEERDDLNTSSYHNFDTICRDLFETQTGGKHYDIRNVPSSMCTSTAPDAETIPVSHEHKKSQTSCAFFDVDYYSPRSARNIHNDLNCVMKEHDKALYDTPILLHDVNDMIKSESFSARYVTPKQIHYLAQRETEHVNEICSITKDIARTVETILYESTRKQQQQQQRFQSMNDNTDDINGLLDSISNSTEEQIPTLNFVNRIEIQTHITMRRIEQFMFILLFEYILPIDCLLVYVYVTRFTLYLQSWLSTSQRVLLLQYQQRLQRYANYTLFVLCLCIFVQRQLLQYTSTKLSTVDNTCNQPQSLYSSNSLFDIKTPSSLSVSTKGDLLRSKNFIEYDDDYITRTTMSCRTTDIFLISHDIYQ